MKRGHWEIIASGICFGWLGFFGKRAYEQGISPGELLALRFFVSGIILGILILLSRSRRDLRVGGGMLLRLMALGVFGYAIFSSCFFYALKGLSASLTVLLLYTYPAMVAVGGWVFLKEPLSRRTLWALPLSVMGTAALVWGEFRVESAFSLVLGLLSAVSYSSYILCSRAWLKGVNPFVSTVIIQLATALVLSFAHFDDFERPIQILTSSTGVVLGVALVGSLFAMSLFLSGLRTVTSAESSILSTTEPLVGVMVAAFFLGERMNAVQVGGGLAVLLSLALVSNYRFKHL